MAATCWRSAGQALLVVADDGGKARRMGRRHMAQGLLRVVELGAGKPVRARHGVLGQHAGVGRGGLQIEVIPDALPESLQIGD
jgi:hypothetical protein